MTAIVRYNPYAKAIVRYVRHRPPLRRNITRAIALPGKRRIVSVWDIAKRGLARMGRKAMREGVRRMINTRVPRAVASRIGERLNNISTNSLRIYNDQDTLDANILYTYALVRQIPLGTGAGARVTNRINLRGIKICTEIKNMTVTPQYLNIALLSPTESTVVDDTAFFRDNSASNNVDFSNTALTAMDKHCRPINKDKYSILMHKRYVVHSVNASASTGYTSGTASNYMYKDFWIPLKRQFGFGQPNSNDEIYLCVWVNNFAQMAPIPVGLDRITFTKNVVLYWNNVQS